MWLIAAVVVVVDFWTSLNQCSKCKKYIDRVSLYAYVHSTLILLFVFLSVLKHCYLETEQVFLQDSNFWGSLITHYLTIWWSLTKEGHSELLITKFHQDPIFMTNNNYLLSHSWTDPLHMPLVTCTLWLMPDMSLFMFQHDDAPSAYTGPGEGFFYPASSRRRIESGNFKTTCMTINS